MLEELHCADPHHLCIAALWLPRHIYGESLLWLERWDLLWLSWGSDSCKMHHNSRTFLWEQINACTISQAWVLAA